MAGVLLKDVKKVYDNGFEAVKGVSLDIADKEFMVIVGPSGCGKTTTLRMIAGLEEISSGTIAIGDKIVNDVPPKDRDIAMVFQNYALYPHMTVFQNIAFGLKLRKYPKSEIKKRVEEVAQMLDITGQLDKKPKRCLAVSVSVSRWSCGLFAIPRRFCLMSR
jgi:multiple sugar transport system ATP-binding protein